MHCEGRAAALTLMTQRRGEDGQRGPHNDSAAALAVSRSTLSAAQPSACSHLPAKPSHHPSAAQPSAAQPSAAQPSTAQPSAAQPAVAQPSVAQPPAAQPSAAQPPAAQPSPAQPASPTAATEDQEFTRMSGCLSQIFRISTFVLFFLNFLLF